MVDFRSIDGNEKIKKEVMDLPRFRNSDIWYVIKELMAWSKKETRKQYIKDFGKKQFIYDITTGIFDILWSFIITLLIIPGSVVYAIGYLMTALMSGGYWLVHRISRKFWLKRAKHKSNVKYQSRY